MRKEQKEERTTLIKRSFFQEIFLFNFSFIYYSTNVILAYPLPLCPVSVPPPGAGKVWFPAIVWALDNPVIYPVPPPPPVQVPVCPPP